MTEAERLDEVLNLRLDRRLAQEIERAARATDRSASEVARTFLGYGAEVARRLEAQDLARHHAAPPDDRPGRVVIEARWEPLDDSEWGEGG